MVSVGERPARFTTICKICFECVLSSDRAVLAVDAEPQLKFFDYRFG